MEPDTFSNTELSKSLFWTTEGHGQTAIQRTFRTTFRKSAPARETIRIRGQEFHDSADHSHRKGNRRPQITAEQKDEIEDQFIQNRRISLPYAALKTGVSRGTL